MRKVLVTVSFLLSILFTIRCGDKFDLGQLPQEDVPATIGDTVYVQQQPVWTGFNAPEDILVGYEPLIYVCDTQNDRIVMLDLSGVVLGVSKRIKRPIAISQDRKLDLLVCGEFDTTINNRAVTYGAIYRIHLFESGHSIANARVDRIYFEPSKPNRRFTGVATWFDNNYYATRVGPENTSPIDPDNAVMIFGRNDFFASPIANLKPNGTGLESISELSSITTLTSRSVDFIFTQTGTESLFKVQWIAYTVTSDFSFYQSKFSPSRDGNLDFLEIGRFKQPEDVTTDASGNIYVIDAGTDSLYKFNNKGKELQSFGGRQQFKNPKGVAWFDKTLYVCDTGNNRVVRFKLSTDIR
jgi:hypothetical protein